MGSSRTRCAGIAIVGGGVLRLSGIGAKTATRGLAANGLPKAHFLPYSPRSGFEAGHLRAAFSLHRLVSEQNRPVNTILCEPHCNPSSDAPVKMYGLEWFRAWEHSAADTGGPCNPPRRHDFGRHFDAPLAIADCNRRVQKMANRLWQEVLAYGSGPSIRLPANLMSLR